MKNETKTGVIVFLKYSKQYGFIRSDDEDKELYFSKAGLISPEFKDLKEGMNVEYIEADKPTVRAIGVVAI